MIDYLRRHELVERVARARAAAARRARGGAGGLRARARGARPRLPARHRLRRPARRRVVPRPRARRRAADRHRGARARAARLLDAADVATATPATRRCSRPPSPAPRRSWGRWWSAWPRSCWPSSAGSRTSSPRPPHDRRMTGPAAGRSTRSSPSARTSSSSWSARWSASTRCRSTCHRAPSTARTRSASCRSSSRSGSARWAPTSTCSSPTPAALRDHPMMPPWHHWHGRPITVGDARGRRRRALADRQRAHRRGQPGRPRALDDAAVRRRRARRPHLRPRRGRHEGRRRRGDVRARGAGRERRAAGRRRDLPGGARRGDLRDGHRRGDRARLPRRRRPRARADAAELLDRDARAAARLRVAFPAAPPMRR